MAVWKNSQSCACRELTERVIVACVTRHHTCAHTFVLCRLEGLSCLPQHTAEVDLEGSVRQTWTQIWMLIRPRSPPMGQKDFPRGSSMTVLLLSICKNDVDFLFISACRQKSAGQGPSGVEKFPRQVQPLSSHRARLPGHVRDRDLCFLMGSLIRLVLHELFDLYIRTN